MNPRRRARVLQRPLVVPPEQQTPNRVTIGPQALRAAWAAHMGHEHDGRRVRGCSTCRRYLEGLVAARAAERTAAGLDT